MFLFLRNLGNIYHFNHKPILYDAYIAFEYANMPSRNGTYKANIFTFPKSINMGVISCIAIKQITTETFRQWNMYGTYKGNTSLLYTK